MTPTELRSAAETMLAYVKMVEDRGEEEANRHIQHYAVGCPKNVWTHGPKDPPNWNWSHMVFRIKPEPREWWIVITKKGGYHDVHDAYPVQQALCANQTQVHVREVLDTPNEKASQGE